MPVDFIPTKHLVPPIPFKECKHINKADVEHDPYRFYCLDCWEYWADYNDGKGFVLAWTFASKERQRVHSSMNTMILVEHISGGQPRPYADHEYESYITFSVPPGQLWGRRFGQTEEQVKPYIKLMIHNFKEEDRQWHEPWLDTLEQVSPGRWHVIVKSPYLD